MEQNLALNKINELEKTILNTAPISIMVINKKGEIVFVNKYFKKFSGSRCGLGRNIKNIPFFVREGLCPLYERVLKMGLPIKKENCRTTNLAGKTTYLSITTVPLEDKNGQVSGILSMALDTTREVETNLKLSELNDELEKKVEERTRQLNKYLRLKSEFIADASHELRTPLSIIRLQMELISSEPGNEKFSNIFTSVEEEINKITEILSNLTFMTSVEEGRERIKSGKLRLNEVIGESARRMEILAARKKIKIINKVQNEIISRGDAEKLERLFLNLIRNAVKYGKKSGWVRIEAFPDASFIKIKISDNGIGIPKKDLPHIFDRFYRSDVCVKHGKSGFGLGLAICKWIAEQHKGSISVKSSIDKGSEFVVRLPVL